VQRNGGELKEKPETTTDLNLRMVGRDTIPDKAVWCAEPLIYVDADVVWREWRGGCASVSRWRSIRTGLPHELQHPPRDIKCRWASTNDGEFKGPHGSLWDIAGASSIMATERPRRSIRVPAKFQDKVLDETPTASPSTPKKRKASPIKDSHEDPTSLDFLLTNPKSPLVGLEMSVGDSELMVLI
jgi:hypothetical protein